MKIAVLITCHNRQAKTEKCLRSLKVAVNEYTQKPDNSLVIEIFLTDDGCTDGTVKIARNVFSGEKVLHIIQGDGNLYWAGGMRLCWNEALKRHDEWDYYLLLNDDVELFPDVFKELFSAQDYVVKLYGKEGIISGITCSKEPEKVMTYGGSIWVNKFLGKSKRLEPRGEPQLCDFTNANILLIPGIIVSQIGVFYDKYRHGQADYDYSVRARKAGYAVVLSAGFCGYCEKDFFDKKVYSEKIISMSLQERKAYFSNPLHSSDDYIRFSFRTSPMRVPIVWIGRMLNLYFPRLYYRMSEIR